MSTLLSSAIFFKYYLTNYFRKNFIFTYFDQSFSKLILWIMQKKINLLKYILFNYLLKHTLAKTICRNNSCPHLIWVPNSLCIFFASKVAAMSKSEFHFIESEFTVPAILFFNQYFGYLIPEHLSLIYLALLISIADFACYFIAITLVVSRNFNIRFKYTFEFWIKRIIKTVTFNLKYLNFGLIF